MSFYFGDRVFFHLILGWIMAHGDGAHVYFSARRCAHILGFWGCEAEHALLDSGAVTLRDATTIPRGAHIDEVELSRLILWARESGGIQELYAHSLYNWVYDRILPAMSWRGMEG